MEKVSDSTKKWYVAPEDAEDSISGTVSTPSKTTISTTSNNTTNGVDITVNSNTNFQTY